MNFREADRRYAALKRQYDNGDLSDEEFSAQLKQMMLQDYEGRWWAKSRETGDWNYYDGNTWVRGTPPDYEIRTMRGRPPEQESPPIQQPEQESPLVQVPLAQGRSTPWIVWGIVITVVGVIVPIPLFPALGIYFGYKARKKGSESGGSATMVVSVLCTLVHVLVFGF